MKKVILGANMMFAGMVSSAILMAGSITLDWRGGESVYSLSWSEAVFSFTNVLAYYGLMPALIVFIAVAFVGFMISVWGVFEKQS